MSNSNNNNNNNNCIGQHAKKVNGFCKKCLIFVCNACNTSFHQDHPLVDTDEIGETFTIDKKKHKETFEEQEKEYHLTKVLIKQHFKSIYDSLQIKEHDIMNQLDTQFNDIKDLFDINIVTFNSIENDLKTGGTINHQNLTPLDDYQLPIKLDEKSIEEFEKKISDQVLKKSYFLNIKNSSNNNNNGYQLFALNHQSISILNDQKTALVKNSGHNNIFTEESFSTGIHVLQIRIDKINNGSHWMYFGVCDQEPETVGGFGYDVSVGISSALQVFDGNKKQNGNLKRDWKDGDIFIVTLNCDEGNVKIEKESTGDSEIRTIPANTKFRFIINLFNEGNQATILN